MKKSLIPLLLLIVAAFSLSAQEIRNIDETVVLRKDGSARITQVWDVTVVSGTEFYLPFDNLGPMEIDDLTMDAMALVNCFSYLHPEANAVDDLQLLIDIGLENSTKTVSRTVCSKLSPSPIPSNLTTYGMSVGFASRVTL